MKENQPKNTPWEVAQNKYKSARANLMLMIVCTLLNVGMIYVGSDRMLLFSATVPYFTTLTGYISKNTPVIVASLGIAAMCLLAYLLCWIFSKKHYGAFIAALVMFALDTAFMGWLYITAGETSGVMDMIFHIWILYYLIVGIRYGKLLRDMPQEPVQAESAPPENSVSLRWADPEVKHRVLLQAEAAGYRICYRRVKRINELVVNGRVYDEVTMVLESPHELTAVCDGHRIQAGYSQSSHSYIIFDGTTIADKIRRI